MKRQEDARQAEDPIKLTIMRKGETKPIEITLTREVIKVQSVKSKLVEPGYGWVRVTQFQDQHGAPTWSSTLTSSTRRATCKGLVLDLRNDPGGLLNGAVGVSAAFLPPETLVTSTDGRTEDAKQDSLRIARVTTCAAPAKTPQECCRSAQKGADGGAGQWRLGFGLGNRRRRAAGSQARRGHGHPDLRQGLGPVRPAAARQHRHQADHGALLHAGVARSRPRASRPTSSSRKRPSLAPYSLSIWYEISDYSLEGLEAALVRQGFHLDQSVYSKMMRAVVYFCEETQMRNMRVPERLIKKSHEVYSKAWEHHPHGDHDETPPELRQER
jgi:hypothetical protein